MQKKRLSGSECYTKRETPKCNISKLLSFKLKEIIKEEIFILVEKMKLAGKILKSRDFPEKKLRRLNSPINGLSELPTLWENMNNKMIKVLNDNIPDSQEKKLPEKKFWLYEEEWQLPKITTFHNVGSGTTGMPLEHQLRIKDYKEILDLKVAEFFNWRKISVGCKDLYAKNHMNDYNIKMSMNEGAGFDIELRIDRDCTGKESIFDLTVSLEDYVGIGDKKAEQILAKKGHHAQKISENVSRPPTTFSEAEQREIYGEIQKECTKISHLLMTENEVEEMLKQIGNEATLEYFQKFKEIRNRKEIKKNYDDYVRVGEEIKAFEEEIPAIKDKIEEKNELSLREDQDRIVTIVFMNNMRDERGKQKGGNYKDKRTKTKLKTIIY